MKLWLYQAVVQLVLALGVSPLVTGSIRKLKAILQNRRGPSLLQPYYDIFKLFRKGTVVSRHASWLFRATPYICFITALMVSLMIPMITAVVPLSYFGGVLAVVYLLALGRFFLALAALDTASAFGGMGSSREMTVSAIAEPAMMLSIFTVAITAGSTNLGSMVQAALQQGPFLSPSHILAFAAMFIPRRACLMRTLLLELERLYNHIADVGAIATDVGFMVANAHAMRLKEGILRLNGQLTGNRLLRAMNVIGGVRLDWDSVQIGAVETVLSSVREEFESLTDLILSSASTLDRLENTGVLQSKIAHDLGVVGVVGRASGVDLDVRRDYPYAAYDEIIPKVSVYHEGDVFCRMKVRMDEAKESIRIALQAIDRLSEGPVRAPFPQLPARSCGLGCVEGWRGEILVWVQVEEDGRISRCKIKDPSLNNWPALPRGSPGEYYSGLSCNQQKLQPVLLGHGQISLSDCEILLWNRKWRLLSLEQKKNTINLGESIKDRPMRLNSIPGWLSDVQNPKSKLQDRNRHHQLSRQFHGTLP